MSNKISNKLIAKKLIVILSQNRADRAGILKECFEDFFEAVKHGDEAVAKAIERCCQKYSAQYSKEWSAIEDYIEETINDVEDRIVRKIDQSSGSIAVASMIMLAVVSVIATILAILL